MSGGLPYSSLKYLKRQCLAGCSTLYFCFVKCVSKLETISFYIRHLAINISTGVEWIRVNNSPLFKFQLGEEMGLHVFNGPITASSPLYQFQLKK